MNFDEIKTLLIEKFNLSKDFDFSSIIGKIEGLLGKKVSDIKPEEVMGIMQQQGGIEGLTSLFDKDGKPGLSFQDIANQDTLKTLGGLFGGSKDEN